MNSSAPYLISALKEKKLSDPHQGFTFRLYTKSILGTWNTASTYISINGITSYFHMLAQIILVITTIRPTLFSIAISNVDTDDYVSLSQIDLPPSWVCSRASRHPRTMSGSQTRIMTTIYSFFRRILCDRALVACLIICNIACKIFHWTCFASWITNTIHGNTANVCGPCHFMQ